MRENPSEREALLGIVAEVVRSFERPLSITANDRNGSFSEVAQTRNLTSQTRSCITRPVALGLLPADATFAITLAASPAIRPCNHFG